LTTTSSTYKGIFKSTALFGFVQAFKVIIGIAKNKIVAVLLGPEGMGIIGIFQTAIQFIQTGAGLGVNQSAVRDISEANGYGDKLRFSKTISVTNQIIVCTGLLGCMITIILSPWLSKWMMGKNGYTFAFICLGLVVMFNIMTEGQLAVLKGMRQLSALAKASLIGSIVGFVTAVPLYYFFGKKGIIPELIIASGLALFFSNYFVKKIDYNKTKFSLKDAIKEASPMIKMGISLMFVSFLGTIVSLIVASFIRRNGGIEIMGYYSAGNAILGSYFGMIITALMTDYYPRISAVNYDNEKLQDELNRQSAVSLTLTLPLVVIFLFLMPLFIQILYTKDFAPTMNYLKYAIYGTLITICSNQVDMILVAKYNIKLFTTIAIIMLVIQVVLSILLFKNFGLMGLGVTVAIMGIFHMTVMTIAVYKLYGIIYNKFFVKLATIVLAFAICASLTSEIENLIPKYTIGSILSALSLTFSLHISKKHFDIDFIKIITNKIKK
jgi:PST family polysaccharide transporter